MKTENFYFTVNGQREHIIVDRQVADYLSKFHVRLTITRDVYGNQTGVSIDKRNNVLQKTIREIVLDGVPDANKKTREYRTYWNDYRRSAYGVGAPQPIPTKKEDTKKDILKKLSQIIPNVADISINLTDLRDEINDIVEALNYIKSQLD